MKTEAKLSIEDLEHIHLKSGSHESRSEGVCAMEAAAWLAGREHTDSPVCVSPTIAAFIRNWNDSLLTDDDRDRLLKPLLPLILKTRTTELAETERAWLAVDWLARTYTPSFMDLTPSLTQYAETLRRLPEFTKQTAEKNQKSLDDAKAASAAAWAAAGDAAWAAAGDAAWAAAGNAARDAAGNAARDAAGNAAWAAAGNAAWAAAGNAARAAAWAAARAAAGAAAGDAARDAAWMKLAPVVVALQRSAQDLVRRMVTVSTESSEPKQ